MEEPSRFKALPLVIAAGCGAIIAIAVFSGGRWPSSSGNTVQAADPAGGTLSKAWKTYSCPHCGQAIEWGKEFCLWCGWDRMSFVTPAANAGQNAVPAASLAQVAATPVANVTPGATTAAPPLLSPREQNAAGKEFIEGHWLGLEVIPLTPELATEYLIPNGENGILVDEITLEAAESGILAGDMVQSVDGRLTPDLKAFFVVTQRVQEKERADVGISRRGQKMTFFMEARNTKTLGFAQMEAAQPIKPGSISPHRSRGKACTECHIIMKTGGQLPTDAGDILPSPPAITKAATTIHGYRGQCVACHVIK